MALVSRDYCRLVNSNRLYMFDSPNSGIMAYGNCARTLCRKTPTIGQKKAKAVVCTSGGPNKKIHTVVNGFSSDKLFLSAGNNYGSVRAIEQLKI